MADHSTFVWVGDCSTFEGLHRGICCLHLRIHLSEEVVAEVDAADVDCEIELVNVEVVLFETVPRHDVCLIKGRSAKMAD